MTGRTPHPGHGGNAEELRACSKWDFERWEPSDHGSLDGLQDVAASVKVQSELWDGSANSRAAAPAQRSARGGPLCYRRVLNQFVIKVMFDCE